MSHNKSVEEVSIDITSHLAGVLPSALYDRLENDIIKAIQQERQTSQEREREIVGKLFEALDYQNTERELNAKEEDRMGIKLALQQFKLKFLTEYNITLTNPNKD